MCVLTVGNRGSVVLVLVMLQVKEGHEVEVHFGAETMLLF